MDLHFLGMCGSLRRQSRNSGLLRCAVQVLPTGASMDIADLAHIPFYREDGDKTPEVLRLLAQAEKADALVLACPEYNYSLAPALKNALDWISREPGNRLLAGKPVAILGAAGGMGSSRSQYHLRQVCVCLDLLPLNRPEVFANAFSSSFDENGDVVEDKLRGQVQALMQALAERSYH